MGGFHVLWNLKCRGFQDSEWCLCVVSGEEKMQTWFLTTSSERKTKDVRKCLEVMSFGT